MIAVVVRSEESAWKLRSGTEKECRWRNVIAILDVAGLKRLARRCSRTELVSWRTACCVRNSIGTINDSIAPVWVRLIALPPAASRQDRARDGALASTYPYARCEILL